MSASYEVTIWCDTCQIGEMSEKTEAALRKELRGLGWTSVKHYQIKDYCPTCSEKRSKALKFLEEIGESHKIVCEYRISHGVEPCNCDLWELLDGKWVKHVKEETEGAG